MPGVSFGWPIRPVSVTPTGIQLLAQYATTVGTDEATPRTVTFSRAATPGRNLVAIYHASLGATLPSPWTVVNTGAGNTVHKVWTLAKADNTGVSSVAVTQAGPAYPFAMVVFEDDIGTWQYSLPARNNQPSAGSWSTNFINFTAGWRTVGWWGAQTYQSAPGTVISGYDHGLVQFADTGVSSVYNSSHALWYSCRTWAAWTDSMATAGASLTATATNPNLTEGYSGILAYTVG